MLRQNNQQATGDQHSDAILGLTSRSKRVVTYVASNLQIFVKTKDNCFNFSWDALERLSLAEATSARFWLSQPQDTLCHNMAHLQSRARKDTYV